MVSSDEALMMAYRRGESKAFDELLLRYRTPLFSTLRRLVGDRALAEDLFQETFLRVIQHAGRYDAGRKFSGWVFRIARNLAVDALRQRGVRREEELDEEHQDPAGGPDRALARAEQGEAISRALELLPLEQREVFLMREWAGLSFKEIAEVTESPLNTVLGRMHLAVKKLRACLAEHAEA
jgi:RNA polymerase sigma-70 factor (ECF subfamily)